MHQNSKGSRGMLSRRAFLGTAATVGSARLAIGAPNLQIEAVDDGFRVQVDGSSVWTVTKAQISASLGAQAQLLPLLSGRRRLEFARVSILGNAEHRLIIEFSNDARDRWSVRAVLIGPLVDQVVFSSLLPPDEGTLWSMQAALPARTSANFRSVLGGALGQGWPISRVRVDRDLSLRLDASSAGFSLLPAGAPSFRTLRLLPADRTDRAGQVLASGEAPGDVRLDLTLTEYRYLRLQVEGSLRDLDVKIVAGPPNAAPLVVGSGPLQLTIYALASEGRFRGSSYSKLQRTRSADGTIEWLLELALDDRDTAFETRYGIFVVKGDGDARTRVVVRDNQLARFEATAELTHYGIRLPGADLGRLDFSSSYCPLGTTCLPSEAPAGLGARVPPNRCAFVLEGMPGATAPSTVRLGPDNQSGPPPVRLALDGARLTVLRARDLMSVTYRFGGLMLEAGRGDARIIRSQATPRPDAILVMDLPPQHVAEQAFARQLAQAPGPDRVLTSTQLATVQSREAVLTSLRANPSPDLTAYKDFARRWGELWEQEHSLAQASSAADHGRRRPPASWEGWEGPEKVWVGSQGVESVFARRLARTLAGQMQGNLAAGGARERIGQMPLGLSPSLVSNIVRRAPATSEGANRAIADILIEAEKRSDEHAILQLAYGEWRRTQTARQALPERFVVAGWLRSWADGLGGDPGSALLRRWANDAGVLKVPEASLDAIATEFEAFWSQDRFPAELPVDARLSGPSRLAFTLKGTDPIPYRAESLADPPDRELRVIQRAGRFEPTNDQLSTTLREHGLRESETAQERLATIAARITAPPDAMHTAIELPFRLLLSPAKDARFSMTRLRPDGAPQPLWRAELMEKDARRASLRAIWSPDLRPEAFSRRAPNPPRGPWAPWALDVSGDGGRRPPFRTSLDAFDRHQIVGLSSVYGLPVIPRRDENGELNASQLAPPPDFRMRDLYPQDIENHALYKPQPLPARLLSLSSLGGSLDLEANFVPPASARDAHGQNLFDAFSIERWRSLIVYGRDITTEVVYKGFLCPLGHRATLVKVTERRFLPPGDNRRPVAYLIQRLFIQIGRPEKAYAAIGQPFAGRAWPAKSIEILTRQSPDLVNPDDDSVAESALPSNFGDPLPRGKLVRKDGRGLVFWPRVVASEAGNVRFRFRVDGAADAVSLPLIFVDNQAAHDPATMRSLQAYYNALGSGESGLRSVAHRGARRRYAREREPGDATYDTETWLLQVDSRLAATDLASLEPIPDSQLAATFGMDSSLESDDQPPFYPRVERARVRLGQVAQFTGVGQDDVWVRYWGQYLTGGFVFRDPSASQNPRVDTASDTFLEVLGNPTAGGRFGDRLPRLGMSTNGDRSGGIARPSQAIVALARFGPVGGAAARSVPTRFEPSFFDQDAKLLGLVSLRDLVGAASAAAAPVLQDVIEFAEGAIDAVRTALTQVVGSLARLEQDQLLRTVYPDAARAVRDLRTSLEPAWPTRPADVTTRVTSIAANARSLLHEVERIAAAPIAPLADAARRKLLEIQRDIGRINQLAGIALPGQMFRILIPISLASLEPNLSEAQIRALAPVHQRVEEALAGGINDALGDRLQPSLSALRGQVSQKIRSRLTEISAQPNIARNSDLANAIAALRGIVAASLEIPDDQKAEFEAGSAARIYRQLAALTEPNLFASLRNIVAEVANSIISWVGMRRDALCTGIGSALRAWRRNTLAESLNVVGCPEFRDATCPVPSSGGEALCSLLWETLCSVPATPQNQEALNAFRTSSASLASALEVLRRQVNATTSWPAQFSSCDDLPFAAFHQVETARKSFGNALGDWLRSASGVAGAVSAEATRNLLTRAASTALQTLQVSVDPNPFDAAVAAVLRDTAVVGEARQAVVEMQTTISRLRQSLTTGAVAARIEALRTAPGQLTPVFGRLDRQATRFVDNALTIAMAPAADLLEVTAERIITPLSEAYEAIVAARAEAIGVLRGLGAYLHTGRAPALACLLVLPERASADACAEAQDRLIQERDKIKAIANGPREARLPELLRLVRTWGSGGQNAPAPLLLLEQIQNQAAAAITAQALQLLPLDNVQERLQSSLAGLLPTRKRLSYDYALPLSEKKFAGDLVSFSPQQRDAKLELTSKVVIDLQRPTTPISSFEGKAGAFNIEIKDYIALKFGEFKFSGGSGGSRFSAPFLGVDIKPNLAFLTALGAYLGMQQGGSAGAGGRRNGPYIRPRLGGGPGVVSGFGLNIGTFSVGAMGFANVFFDAHCELPFNSDQAVVRLALSSRDAPFTMFATPYGGSGYFGIEATAEGVRRFDVSMEWGGASAIKFGPLEGIGRVMTGVYIEVSDRKPKISGTFTAGFVGHVACFGVASSFNFQLTPSENGSLSGEAWLTYSFSVGIAKINFSVRVWKAQAPGFRTASFTSPEAPRVMFASTGSIAAACFEREGRATSRVPSPLADWDGYIRLHDRGLTALGRRRR